MPLNFDSVSHGTVAFGFFNIDADMLLLEHYFFFSTEFCSRLLHLADEAEPAVLEGYSIENPARIGNLIEAIHGYRLTGFIGEVYEKFPFPEKPEDFKQKPEGSENQELIRSIIEKHARPVSIPLTADRGRREAAIGEFRFTQKSFHELIRYVWRGGFPRWRDEQRPGYLVDFGQRVDSSHFWLFDTEPGSIRRS